MRIAAAVFCAALSTGAALAQSPEAGRREYERRCSRCHGGDGNGGEHAPGIVTRLALRRDDEGWRHWCATVCRAAGMPGFPIPDEALRALVAFLRR